MATIGHLVKISHGDDVIDLLNEVIPGQLEHVYRRLAGVEAAARVGNQFEELGDRRYIQLVHGLHQLAGYQRRHPGQRTQHSGQVQARFTDCGYLDVLVVFLVDRVETEEREKQVRFHSLHTRAVGHDEAGIRHIGENRAGELSHKKAQLLELLPDATDLMWHQIGTLQSRKTKLVAEDADYFHALDRMKIARRLSRQLVDGNRSLPVLIEVNLSGESSKSGFLVNNWEEDATQRESLRKVSETIAQLPGLQLQGLMTMAPWDVEEKLIRSVFRRTRLLTEWLQSELPTVELNQLSMGMTDDFEIAIEEGATYVRVGRAIFGPRHHT